MTVGPETITVNLSTKGVRYARLEGREHVVVPMVMMVPGVHAGSNGPLLYSEDEMNRPPVVASWNHRPVVV